METKQTPKEKAEVLVYRYIDEKLIKDSFFCEDLYSEIYSSEIELKNAKQCALIAVDEIIELESARLIVGDINDVEYWEEVKQEIEKL